jgi:ABC-2 type transport system permease protein
VFLKPVEMAQVQHTQMAAVMNQLLSNSRFTLMPLLPSYWLTTSLISWGEGWGGNGALYFMVLASNAMMATVVCVGIGERFFYEGWSRVHSQGGLRIGVALLDRQVGVPRTGWIERAIYLLPRIHPATRALVMKDIRVFWRDTSQWSQFVIFFGLLGLYVLNLRNVAYDTSSDFFARFVSVMNLGACSMTLGTLTTRFVFPQFSLEGKRLWIVGMVPYGLKRVLLQKFWLSSVTSIVITVSLMLISSVMLRLPAWLMLLFCATMVLMSFALCGIAVGLGALFPNFGTGSTANRRDDNPARIVSGFGGTFCFVLSLVYIAIVIAAEAWPMYMQYAGGDGTMRVPIAMVAAWLFVSFLSLAAASIPMQLALRRVESLEM